MPLYINWLQNLLWLTASMDFQTLSVTIFFTLLLLFLMKKKGRRLNTQHPIPKLPPGPWKLPILPIVGNIHNLIGPLPHHTLRDLALKYGPLMQLRLGHLPIVVVSSSRVAKEVMKTHDLKFASRPKLLAGEVITYEYTDLAFAPYGDYWRHLRKVCMLKLLSAKRVESFRSVREEEASRLIQDIYTSSNSPVDLTEKIFTFTNSVITRSSIGERWEDREQFLHSLKETIKLMGGFHVSEFFPSLKFLPVVTGMKFRLERAHRKYDNIIGRIIEERRRERAMNEGGSQADDLLDILLDLQKDEGLELPITTDNIKAILLDMVGGGTDTSSTVIQWAMAEMMRNPKVMEKAQAEVRQALKGKTKMDEGDTTELHYLNLVIKETLRLHTPIPLLLPRECRETCEIDGYDIPIGTRVMINAWAIGRDPQTWDEAELFNPERFDGNSIDYKGTHFEYLPFGAGRRICLGMTMGMANVTLPLAQLLYYFDWKLPNGMKVEDLDMVETFGAIIGRRSSLYVIPSPRFPFPQQ